MKLTSNRKVLILVFLAFLIPVILAKLALEFNWFNKAATNHGELLNPTLDLSSLDTRTSWRILYLMPQQCEQVCDNALYSIHQVWKALGREQHRAEAVVVVPTDHQGKVQEELAEYTQVRMVSADPDQIRSVFNAPSSEGIFLVDTLNNVILRYPVAEEKEQAVLDSRNILADLRKLLKLSRIG
ncbi:hypothetical protein [Lacimicrobium sp. SS2-24]|uniref:hypothetical protein n=1 Tax=Lacimicrobium sp. SS2-24 TaxID=2005569 RepID=UPI000B4B9D85|nr:hypothetical protein [Lacimicrobium sp. SS2-24]